MAIIDLPPSPELPYVHGARSHSSSLSPSSRSSSSRGSKYSRRGDSGSPQVWDSPGSYYPNRGSRRSTKAELSPLAALNTSMLPLDDLPSRYVYASPKSTRKKSSGYSSMLGSIQDVHMESPVSHYSSKHSSRHGTDVSMLDLNGCQYEPRRRTNESAMSIDAQSYQCGSPISLPAGVTHHGPSAKKISPNRIVYSASRRGIPLAYEPEKVPHGAPSVMSYAEKHITEFVSAVVDWKKVWKSKGKKQPHRSQTGSGYPRGY